MAILEREFREYIRKQDWRNIARQRNLYKSCAYKAAEYYYSQERFKEIMKDELAKLNVETTDEFHSGITKYCYKAIDKRKMAIRAELTAEMNIPPCPPMQAVIGPIRKPNPAYAASRLHSPI